MIINLKNFPQPNNFPNQTILVVKKQQIKQTNFLLRHVVVYWAAQEAGMSYCEYIDRKKKIIIFTPM